MSILPTEIKQALAAYISGTVDPYKLEIEFRFSEYYHARQEREDRSDHRGVNLAAFHRLKAYAHKRQWQHQFTSLIDYTQTVEGIKYRKSINQLNNQVSWNEKRLIKNYDHLSDYYIRLGVNTERDLPFIPNFVESNQRIKYRDTYYINNLAKLDLTYVEMDTDIDAQKRNKEEIKRYEVELEIIDLTRLNEIDTYVLEILRVIQDTKHLYSIKTYREIVSFVNRTLNPSFMGPQSSIEISDWNLHQARNLKFQDLIWGGLVGNQQYSYRATIKADGLRKLLVFHYTGIWMVMAPGNASLIWKNYQNDLIIPEDYVARTNLNGYILEGEYIPMENRTDRAPVCEYLYYAFDVLASRPSDRELNPSEPGLTNIQKRPHHERMREVFDVIEKFFSNNQLLTVLGKKFHSFYTVEEFYQIMRHMESMRTLYPFIDDGYIFMPDEMPYDYSVQKLKALPPQERNLTKHPDICKWKPKEKLTIDFAIKLRFNDIELLVGHENVNFQTLVNEPIKIDKDHPLLNGLKSGAVVEFKYQNDIFIPVRLRGDKQFPNSRKVAIDTWHQIMDPIEIDTLKGLNLQLTRKYHNRIKTDIYREIKGETLLDIGVGYGGDQNKWYNIGLRKIVGVEPNPDNIQEFIRRLKVSKYQQKEIEVIIDESELWKVSRALNRSDNVILIQTGGENSHLITQVVRLFMGKADAITSMLSLSFFWLTNTESHQETGQLIEGAEGRDKMIDDSKLNGLIETIMNNTDGEFHYFTIDGDLVEEYMNPTFGGPQFDTIRLYDDLAEIRYSYPKRMVEIYLKDSIVGLTNIGNNDTLGDKQKKIIYQKEGLVKIDDLILRLPNMNHTNYLRADQEGFLSPGGALFSSMYSYGKFVPKKIEEKKYLENKNQLIEMSAPILPPSSVQTPASGQPFTSQITTSGPPITQSIIQPINQPIMQSIPIVSPPRVTTVSPPRVTTVSPPRVSIPTVSPPRVSIPTVSTVSPPRVSPVSPPRVSPVSPPRVSPPRVSIPTVSPPRVSIPTVSPPRVSIPTVSPPRVSPPRVSPPRVSIPTVSPPRVSIPTVSPPRVSIPIVSPPRVTTVSPPVVSPPRDISILPSAQPPTLIPPQVAPLTIPAPSPTSQMISSTRPSQPFVSLPPGGPTFQPPTPTPSPGMPTLPPGVPTFQSPTPTPSPGMPTLPPGVPTLQTPTPSLPSGVPIFQPPTTPLPPGMPTLPPGVPTFQTPTPTPSLPSGVPTFQPPTTPLPPGMPTLPPGVPTFQTPTTPLPPGVPTFQTPTTPLPSGVPTFQPPTTPLPSGIPTPQPPTPTPSPGMPPLPPGVPTFQTPTSSLPSNLPPGLPTQPLPSTFIPPASPLLTQQSVAASIIQPVMHPTLQPVSAPQQVVSIPEKDKFRRAGRLLPSIRLTYDEITKEVYGDNKVETINCSWYKQYPVVRIASAGPKTCFLECLMNAVDSEYSKKRSYVEKQQIIANFKSDLVDGLTIPSSDNRAYWEVLSEKTGHDYNTLVRMIRTEEGYDTTFLEYICDLISLGIYTFEIHEFDLIYKNKAGPIANGIIILGKSQSRYELIGVDKGNFNIQTVFNPKDEIIIASGKEQVYNLMINHVYTRLDRLKQRSDWSEIEKQLIEFSQAMTDISEGKPSRFIEVYTRLHELVA